jgi:hypothetical protein
VRIVKGSPSGSPKKSPTRTSKAFASSIGLEKEHGARFKRCNLLKEMAGQDKTFYKM